MDKCARCGRVTDTTISFSAEGHKPTKPVCMACFRQVSQNIGKGKGMTEKETTQEATPGKRLDDIKELANEVLVKRAIWDAKKSEASDAKKDFDIESAKLLDFIVDENQMPLFEGAEEESGDGEG